MNISIITAKTVILAAALVLVFSATLVAKAEVSIVTATLDGQSTPLTVEPSATVAVGLTVARVGSEEQNDWEGTSYRIGDADAVCLDIPDPDITDGNLNSTTTFDITAPVAEGTYDIVIGVYRDDTDNASTTSNNPCPSFQRATTSLTLIVDDPAAPVVDPFIEVLNIDPDNAIRNPGDSINYEADIRIGGDPEVARLQCVVFDIDNDEAWQEVSVNLNASGTHFVSQNYDLTGYATGTYEVRAIAFDVACDDIAVDFDPDTFATAGLYATTTLTIGEANTLNIDLTGDGAGTVEANGGLIDDIACSSDGTNDCSGTYASGTVIILTATPDNDSTFNGWSTVLGNAGTCTDNATQCEITMSAAVSLEANFDGDSSSGGGGGGGERLSLSDPDYNDSLNDDEDENEDEDEDDSSSSGSGQVLGEATSIIPIGAPNTGAGGAAPLKVSLPLLTAILATHTKFKKLK